MVVVLKQVSEERGKLQESIGLIFFNFSFNSCERFDKLPHTRGHNPCAIFRTCNYNHKVSSILPLIFRSTDGISQCMNEEKE